MARLLWNQRGERLFEGGVDRGVYYSYRHYVEGHPKGFTWNGLMSVDSRQEGVSNNPLYYDGRKILDVVSDGDFAGSIKALTYPDVFVSAIGFNGIAAGVFFDNQPRSTFGLSYRTLLGNDVKGRRLGYKIHLLYNLTAIEDTRSYQSIDSNIAPIVFSWDITSVPEIFPAPIEGIQAGYRPTAHIILDSTTIDEDNLLIIENILYGSEGTEARLLSIEELFELYEPGPPEA